jgi:uncharacterized OB-fold protein
MTPDEGIAEAAPEPTRFEPPMSPAGRPFWDATREQRLVLQWCRSCDEPIHYPRDACPRCLGDDLEVRPSAGTGEVYAASTMPKPGNPFMKGREPYVVALVALDDGVRLLTNLVDVDPDDVRVGQRVEVTWEALSDGRHLPQFRPADR